MKVVYFWDSFGNLDFRFVEDDKPQEPVQINDLMPDFLEELEKARKTGRTIDIGDDMCDPRASYLQILSSEVKKEQKIQERQDRSEKFQDFYR